MKQLASALVVTLTAGLIGLSAPTTAIAEPSAAPPAFSLHRVSGGFEGEDEYVDGRLLDISADGNRVLYRGYVDTPERYSIPTLFVHDRTTGEKTVVDARPGQPGTPGANMGAETAALSADGSVVRSRHA